MAKSKKSDSPEPSETSSETASETTSDTASESKAESKAVTKPAKADASAKAEKAEKKARPVKVRDPLAPERGPIVSVRFIVALLLMAAGIAWVTIWTLYTRDLTAFQQNAGQGAGPSPLVPQMKKLDDWNWLVGFGLFFLGLTASAHPSTPLGRNRGVVIGMLGCFLVGLLWICTFYVFADKIGENPNSIWLLGSLGQLNLLVGIGFMAVGFTFATRWE